MTFKKNAIIKYGAVKTLAEYLARIFKVQLKVAS